MKSMRSLLVAAAFVLGTTLVGLGAQDQGAPAPRTVSTLSQVSGSPIDVDYQSANLRTVLRQLAEIGGVNLVIDPSVPTDMTVDLRLQQVPWDQVMELVLRTGQLVGEINGPVVRVLTRKAQTDEFTVQTTQRKASEELPDLSTVRVRLNYSTAESMQRLVEAASLLSARGTVEFDERSNMLIVKDTPRNVQEVQTLVSELDQPEPQVEIEAKILRTNRETARALGVQWGFNGRMAPDLGNTSGLGFPNRGTVGGRVVEQGPVTQGPNDPRASEVERAATAINLAAPGASSALGLSLGAINGAFGLDVALTALERDGRATILSTPRVTTQNNQLAEITQGFQVPIQVVADNTVTVQFKDAALKLTVTPQITGANTVIMRIILENATPDFSRAVNGNPSIATQRAETRVQVGDGITTVIGGILQSSETSTVDSTPGLSDLPLLGWLFKRTDTRNESQELLIFITPRIIRG
jgi:type IV pilus assembly protein PilQ